ncbi:MAG: RNA polymerase sigma factor [Longimicrobiales bacterium]
MDRLAHAARAGDEAALNELIRRARPRVFRWALVVTGDADEAEDVVQDVAVAIVRRLDSFRGGSFAGWLYRVTTNAARDAGRRKQRRPIRLLDVAHPGFVSEPTVGPDALDALVRGELASTLRRFLNGLPERQRVLMDLVDVQGHTAVEAAAMLGIEASTARVHLLRARRELRARLLEERRGDPM